MRAVRTADFSVSALVEHTWYCGHPVEWENVAHTLDLHIRLALESVHINIVLPTNYWTIIEQEQMYSNACVWLLYI